MDDEILALKEIAVYLKLAEKTIYRLAVEGKLPGFKVGGSSRISGMPCQRVSGKEYPFCRAS